VRNLEGFAKQLCSNTHPPTQPDFGNPTLASTYAQTLDSYSK